MIRPTSYKKTLTNYPTNVLTFLKGYETSGGGIYDYVANIAPTTGVRTPAYTKTANITTNATLPGTPGDWGQTTTTCFKNITGSCTGQGLYLSSPLNTVTYDNTMMFRFYLNALSTTNGSMFMFNGISGGYPGYGGYGVFVEPNTTNLWGLSGGVTAVGPITSSVALNTWYSLALTIDSSAHWIVYMNGTTYDLGYVGINPIVYGGFSVMATLYNGGLYDNVNGYMTDCIFVNKALPSNICLGYSRGGSIF